MTPPPTPGPGSWPAGARSRCAGSWSARPSSACCGICARRPTATLVTPGDLPADQALVILRQGLKRDSDRHLRWFLLNLVGLIVSVATDSRARAEHARLLLHVHYRGAHAGLARRPAGAAPRDVERRTERGSVRTCAPPWRSRRPRATTGCRNWPAVLACGTSPRSWSGWPFPLRDRLAPVTLQELAERIGARLEGDGTLEVTRVAGLEAARPGDVTFLANERYSADVAATQASAVILGPTAAAAPCAVLRVGQSVSGLRARGAGAGAAVGAAGGRASLGGGGRRRGARPRGWASGPWR